MMNNIMCDLETLSSNMNAIIISIGLVYFDFCKKQLGEELYIEISLPALEEQLSLGRTFSLETMSWWCQQSDGARKVWRKQEGIEKLNNREAINALNNFFEEDNVCLWGNGATFDNVILRSYLNSFGENARWHYSKDMCYRTMKNLFGNKAKFNRIGEHHNALDDAKSQAQHLLDMHSAIHKNKDKIKNDTLL